MLFKKKIVFIIVLLICTFFQVLPVIRSGLNYSYGMGFWGPNGHDGIWHLSLINHINNPSKIILPTMAGENLNNYHPFYDILIKFLSNLSSISTTTLLFQILPIIMAFSFLYLSFLIGGYPLMLINTFATSLGPLIGKSETSFWSMQSMSNQLNPPFMLSLVFLSYLIYAIYKKKQIKNYDYILSFLFLSLLPITKIYAAPIGFFLYLIFSLKNYSKNKKPLIVLIASVIFAFILFFQYNSISSGLLLYKPLWFINTMFESRDRFYFPKLVGMIYALKDSGKFSPRLFVIESFGIVLFIIGNFSFRLLGFLKPKKEYIFLILITVLIPLLFIQKGTAWNTIQFLYYGLFLSNILLANYLSDKKTLFIMIIAISFCANISIFKNYLGNPAPSAISHQEIQALNYLKKLPPGIVLVHPYDSYLKNSFTATPLPLFVYETTAYVSALSQKPVYLEDEMNLQILGKNYQSRKDQLIAFFGQKNQYQDRGFLVNNNLDYIYLNKAFGVNLENNSLSLGIQKIYENDQVLLFKVQR